MNDEDRQLFEGIRVKDVSAFDSLFRKYYVPLLGQAMQLVGREDAENIVQDFMLDLWQHGSKIIIHSSVGAYLKTSIHYRCLNAINHEKTKEKYISNTRLQIEEAIDETDSNYWEDMANHLREAIKLLPNDQRITFEMHRFQGLSYNEISKRFSISEKTVEYRISQALKFLRAKLKRHSVDNDKF